jgi:hypothetical protein
MRHASSARLLVSHVAAAAARSDMSSPRPSVPYCACLAPFPHATHEREMMRLHHVMHHADRVTQKPEARSQKQKPEYRVPWCK